MRNFVYKCNICREENNKINLMKFGVYVLLAGLGVLGFAQEQPKGSLVTEEDSANVQDALSVGENEFVDEIIDEIIALIPDDKPTREKVADVMQKIENKIRMKESSDREHAKSVMKAMKHLGAEHGKEAFTNPATVVRREAAKRRERRHGN